MQALGGEHVAAKLGEDGFEGGGASADPVGERRDFELDSLAGESGALPVQRQVVAKLADQDHGEQARAGEAARDRVRRRRRLGDAIAVPAGELLAHVLDDLPAPRLAFERLRHHLAELAQPIAAALAADAWGGLDDALDRQVPRQLAGSVLRASPRRLRGLGRRDLGLGLLLGLCLFKVRDRQFKLLDEELAALGRLSVGLAARLGELKRQPLDLQGADFRLVLRLAQRRLSLSASISRWARIIACGLARSPGSASGRPSAECSKGLATTRDVSRFGSESRP